MVRSSAKVTHPRKANNTFRLTLRGQTITALRLDALTHPQLPRGGPGRSVFGTGALSEIELSVAPADQPDQQQKISWSRALSDVNPDHSPLPNVYRDKDPTKDDRVTGPVSYAIDGDKKTAWTTAGDPGRRNVARHAIFVPDGPIKMEGDVVLSITLRQLHGGWNSDDNQNYLLGRYRFAITDDEQIPESSMPTDVEAALARPAEDRSDQEHDVIFSHWRTTVPEFGEAQRPD